MDKYEIWKYIKDNFIPNMNDTQTEFIKLISNDVDNVFYDIFKNRNVGISTAIDAFCVTKLINESNLKIGIFSPNGINQRLHSDNIQGFFMVINKYIVPLKYTSGAVKFTNNSELNFFNSIESIRGHRFDYLFLDEVSVDLSYLMSCTKILIRID